MGLTTIQVLKRVYRVKQVIVVDRIDERLQMAERNGADWVINNSNEPLADTLKAQGILPTLIIDAACHPSILQEAVTLALAGGKNCLDGLLD